MSYVGEKPFDPLTLDIWLDSKARSIIYLEEEIIECVARRTNGITIDLKTSRQSGRTFILKINKVSRPKEVRLDDLTLAKAKNLNHFKNESRSWWFDKHTSTLYVKLKALFEERNEASIKIS